MAGKSAGTSMLRLSFNALSAHVTTARIGLIRRGGTAELSARPHDQLLALGRIDLEKDAAVRFVLLPERRDEYRDLLAALERLRRPSPTRHVIGRRALD